MVAIPTPRRLLLPALIILAFIILYKSSYRTLHVLPSVQLHRSVPPEGVRVPIAHLDQHVLPFPNATREHVIRPAGVRDAQASQSVHVDHDGSAPVSLFWEQPGLNPHLQVLLQCPTQPNRFTNHIRLPHVARNISMIPRASEVGDARVFWNPTIISLPSWSATQYLVVSRIVTDGFHQQNVLCEADVCYTGSDEGRVERETPCTELDIALLGPAGGMRCVTKPITLDVPPTPAEKCEGKFAAYVDIPGFHDPRVFWSGRGEPLMMVNTQSRYACFGLWLVDLRALHAPLRELLASSPTHPSLGPLMSYPTLTELTRNPATDRSAMEKNWMLFSNADDSYVQYEISPRRGRTFAKLLGGGLTTTNLTDPLEQACLTDAAAAAAAASDEKATWHQATNSLRLVLCERADARCKPGPENTVFFAVVHRKYANALRLPMRYERYLIVWAASAPFGMLGVSRHPVLVANETASGWSARENWDDDAAALRDARPNWAYFTYTTSIAYAWGRDGDEALSKNTGFLDDDVILNVGVDDAGQVFARVPVRELLQCLRACPGRAVDGSEDG